MPRVVVPATSANLGPGFDVLGLCFDLSNTFTYSIESDFQCTGFSSEYDMDHNLVIKSYKTIFALLSQDPIPIHLHAQCEIPISRGLGSSSSCIIAGCVIANEVLNHPFTKEEIAKFATTIEGHPDNVIPCLFGGLVASKFNDNHLFTVSYPISTKLHFLVLIPDFELETATAREILKPEISRIDAISNIQNTLLLLEGLRTGNEALIHEGINDTIHVPYRKTLIEDYDILKHIVYKHGGIGFTISGAGPTCLAIFTNEIPIDDINIELVTCAHHWKIMEMFINMNGTRIEV
ncbi:homoserine kinase [Anaerorhabdus furcosa]|uniref:Homoserine kinase n=1 Tax=Anaerorhabdus furcosa TaxID=118967 RepID=A0A1T4LA58_9FIRM|nr:homoserine kinase [Anaerorhabdus furcosa]SJZ51662.1 homoserine kinase [Anaerorhabdus furcosa]